MVTSQVTSLHESVQNIPTCSCIITIYMTSLAGLYNFTMFAISGSITMELITFHSFIPSTMYTYFLNFKKANFHILNIIKWLYLDNSHFLTKLSNIEWKINDLKDHRYCFVFLKNSGLVSMSYKKNLNSISVDFLGYIRVKTFAAESWQTVTTAI